MKWGVLLSLWCVTAQAYTGGNWQKEMVEVRPGKKLYVEHRRAAAGKPTLFMLNGLTWSTRDWKEFVQAMEEIDPGIGFVLYDPRGMGRTLLEYAPIRENIELEDQVEDLKELRQKLNVEGKTALSGLSYGGALAISYTAKYPRDFEQTIVMAPFIERLSDQDLIIHTWISMHRLWFPLDPRTEEELYDAYLRLLIYGTYPLAEPVLLENQYKLEATYRMVQGAKDFTAAGAVPRLPKNKLHIVGALDDEHVKEERLAVFWEAVKGKAASYLRLAHTKHKIPQQRPEVAASWVYEIISGNPHLKNGAVFEGDPILGKARSGRIEIPLKKASFCDTLLRATRGHL